MISAGWGAECHWAQLIGTNHRDMAILDEVTVQHTRPIQSGQPLHQDELVAYLKKYNLSMQIFDYGNILHHGDIPEVCDRDTWHRLRRMLEKWVCCDRYSAPQPVLFSAKVKNTFDKASFEKQGTIISMKLV